MTSVVDCLGLCTDILLLDDDEVEEEEVEEDKSVAVCFIGGVMACDLAPGPDPPPPPPSTTKPYKSFSDFVSYIFSSFSYILGGFCIFDLNIIFCKKSI